MTLGSLSHEHLSSGLSFTQQKQPLFFIFLFFFLLSPGSPGLSSHRANEFLALTLWARILAVWPGLITSPPPAWFSQLLSQSHLRNEERNMSGAQHSARHTASLRQS